MYAACMQHEQAGNDGPVWAIAPSRFGKRVKSQREAVGWSQRELSERLAELGVKLDTSAITRIENGSRDPRLKEATAIAHALEIRFSELLNFNEDPWAALYSARVDLEKATSQLREAYEGAVDGVDHIHTLLNRPDVQEAIKQWSPQKEIDDAVHLCNSLAMTLDDYDPAYMLRDLSLKLIKMGEPTFSVSDDGVGGAEA